MKKLPQSLQKSSPKGGNPSEVTVTTDTLINSWPMKKMQRKPRKSVSMAHLGIDAVPSAPEKFPQDAVARRAMPSFLPYLLPFTFTLGHAPTPPSNNPHLTRTPSPLYLKLSATEHLEVLEGLFEATHHDLHKSSLKIPSQTKAKIQRKMCANASHRVMDLTQTFLHFDNGAVTTVAANLDTAVGICWCRIIRWLALAVLLLCLLPYSQSCF